MPKIFVLRNRLQEQQARLLETQKGQHIKIRTDELSTDAHLNQQHRQQQQQQQNHGGSEMQDEPVALIVDRKSDITAAVAAISLTATTSDKDNHQQQQPAPPCQQQPGKNLKLNILIRLSIYPAFGAELMVHSGGTTRMTIYSSLLFEKFPFFRVKPSFLVILLKIVSFLKKEDMANVSSSCLSQPQLRVGRSKIGSSEGFREVIFFVWPAVTLPAIEFAHMLTLNDLCQSLLTQ